MRVKNIQRERLLACASQDDTRIALTGIYHDNSVTKAVSTDGSRLYACRSEYRAIAANEISNHDVLKASGEHVKLDAEYPDWQTVFKFNPEARPVYVHVPKWVSKLKPKDNAYASILLDQDCPKLVIGGSEGLNFNLALLAPFAGEEITLWVEPGLKPFYVTEQAATPTSDQEFRDLDWYCVIMPCRSGNAQCSYLNALTKSVIERILK